MKILQVFNNYLQPGGEATSVDRMARHLEQGGHEVSRFLRQSSEWQEESAPSRWKQPLLLASNPQVLDELVALHESVKPDLWLLHNVLPVISLGIYERAQQLGVPIVQWLHNYRPISPSGTLRAGSYDLSPSDPHIDRKETLAGAWRGSRLQTAWLSWQLHRLRKSGSLKSVRAWVAVSEAMRQTFEEADFYPERLAALPHAWDIQPPEPQDESDYFLFLGRLTPEKGVSFLVDVFKDPDLQDVRLKITGEGPLRGELEPDTPTNVEWLGHMSGAEKRRLIRGARAVLFPSLWREPLSTIAWETYEQERPLVSSSSGGMKETVVESKTGHLLPPGDAEAWKQTVLTLHESKEAAMTMGREGRRWLEEHVTPEKWVAGFNRIVKEMVLS